MGLWSWLKDRGTDIEESRIGGAILGMEPSIGMSTGGEGVQFQAGLGQGPGAPLATYDVGQAGQAGQAGQGRDWTGAFMSLLPALAKGVGTYQQFGREEKDRERMAEAQSRANLVNLVAGRNVMSPDYTPSKVGGLEKLAKVGGQVLQVGQQQRALADQAKLRDLQIKAARGNVAAQADLAKKRGLELRAGEATDAARAAYYGDTTAAPEDTLQAWSPESVEEGARRHWGEIRAQDSPIGRAEIEQEVKNRTFNTDFERFDPLRENESVEQRQRRIAREYNEELKREFGQYDELPGTKPAEKPTVPVDPTADFTDRQRGIYEEEFSRLGNVQTKREREENLYNLQTEAARANIDLTKIKTVHQKALSEMADTKAVLAIASSFGAVNPGLSKDEFFNSPIVAKAGAGRPLTAEQESAMYATYKVAERDQNLALSKAARERRDIFQKNMRSEEVVKIRASIMRAWSMMQNGVKVGSGMGDVQLMKMLALLQDPGSVVREQEYNTLADAVGAFEKALVIAPGLIEGDKLTDDGRARILRLGMLAYQDRMGEIDQLADAYTESELGVSMADASPEQLQLYKLASNPFRMPPIDENKVRQLGLIGKRALLSSLDRSAEEQREAAGLAPVADIEEQDLLRALKERTSAAAQEASRESWGPWAGMVPGQNLPYQRPQVTPKFGAVGRVQAYPGRPY